MRSCLGVPRAPVTLCLSDDGGRSFALRQSIEDGPGTCLSNDSTDGRNQEMSYPWLLEGPDGTCISPTPIIGARSNMSAWLPAGTVRLDGVFHEQYHRNNHGRPCGVGPEISVRALAEMSREDRARTRIYGNVTTLEAARTRSALISSLSLIVVDLPIEGAPLPWGQLSPVAGDAAFRFIEKAVRDAEAGDDRLHRHRADQQGGAEPRRPSL